MGSKDACPTCGKPVVEGFAPFCSKRCAEVDLGRWFKGSYAIPGRSAMASGTSSVSIKLA